MKRVRISLAAAALAALAFAGVARADNPDDAYAAAKAMVPASAQVFIGLNIATIKSSALFQQMWPQLMAQAGDAGSDLEKMKADCGIDLRDALQGVVVALDESQKGAVYVSLKGVDQGRVLECMNKMGKKDNKSFSATKPDARGIIEYTESGSKKKVYVAWLPRNVVAVSTEEGDKGHLEKWLTGKGAATTQAQSALGKVKTNAALWGVVAQPKQLEPGVNMKLGYGHADIAAGNIGADIRVQLANPKEATDAAAKYNKQLTDARASKDMPPALGAMLKSVTISSQADEVQLKASMPEKEVLNLIGMAMQGGH